MSPGDWYDFELHGHDDVLRLKVTDLGTDGIVVHNPDAMDSDEVEMILYWGAIESLIPAPPPFEAKDGDLIRETDDTEVPEWYVRIGGYWWVVGSKCFLDSDAEHLLKHDTITRGTAEQLIEDYV